MAASVLICVSCQRAACLVKSGNQNINGDGVSGGSGRASCAEWDKEQLNGRLTVWSYPTFYSTFLHLNDAHVHFYTGLILSSCPSVVHEIRTCLFDSPD